MIETNTREKVRDMDMNKVHKSWHNVYLSSDRSVYGTSAGRLAVGELSSDWTDEKDWTGVVEMVGVWVVDVDLKRSAKNSSPERATVSANEASSTWFGKVTRE